MNKLLLCFLINLLVFLSNVAQAQKACRIKDTDKLSNFKPRVNNFQEVDTASTGGYAYRCQCNNGNVVLGNFNEEGKASGKWIVEMENKKYKVKANGSMINGKVEGLWFDSNWCSYDFEKGKLIRRVCAK